MRYYFPLILLSLFAPTILHAQHAHVGVKAGLTTSTYHGDPIQGARPRFGAATGVLLCLPLGTHLDLQPELLYEQRGMKSSYTKTYTGLVSSWTSTHAERTRLHYASLPVLVRLHKKQWFAVVGPHVSYLLAEQRRTTDRVRTTAGVLDPGYEAIVTQRNVQEYYRWEVGYVLGAGYQVTPQLGVELRYAAGLTQLYRPLDNEPPLLIWDPSLILPEPVARVRNGSLQAQVSYQLGTL
jgi:hypothetical protein